MKKIYIGSLYRFGYDIQVAAKTEKEVKELLMAEYLKTYLEWNDGEDPREEESEWGNTYYENAEECIEIVEMELGKVEWR